MAEALSTKLARGKTERRGIERGEMAALVVTLAATAALAWRMAGFIREYDVNLLASDDWDYLEPMFRGESLRQLYFFSYNRMHEGIGFVLDKYVLQWSRWNTTTVSLFLAAVMVAATLAALGLKRRLTGRLEIWDATIPCIFLSLRQYEIFISSHNPSSQAFPVLMVVGYCLSWLAPRRGWRYVAVLAVNALAIDSGYAYFLGFLTPVLFGIELLRAVRAKDRSGARAAGAAAAIAFAWMAAFWFVVQPGTGVECVRPRAWSYLEYVALMFANNGGLLGVTKIAVIAGLALLAATLAIFALELRSNATAQEEKRRDLARALITLSGFALLIGAATAIGRACLPIELAQSSRYVPYLMPALLAIYLRAAAVRRGVLRSALLTAVLVSTAAPAIFLTPQDWATIRWLSGSKRVWGACYLETEDIRRCDAAARFALLDPLHERGMKEKLEFLKRNQLNLYAPK